MGFNILTQTQQIQQPEGGTNRSSALNNFTQTSRPSENNMGTHTSIPFNNTT